MTSGLGQGSAAPRRIAHVQTLDFRRRQVRDFFIENALMWLQDYRVGAVRFVKDGVTEAELKDAVSGLLTQREQSRASDGTIAGMLSDQLFYGRTMQFTAELDAKYAALTVDQVNAAIRTYFKPDALSVFLAGDFAGKAGAAATAAPTK